MVLLYRSNYNKHRLDKSILKRNRICNDDGNDSLISYNYGCKMVWGEASTTRKFVRE